MNEIWKDIPEYEGLYQASNLGRIRSLGRITSDGHCRKSVMLSQRADVSGYKRVVLSRENIKRTKSVHRLVAISFWGERKGKVVDHIDGDPTNNLLENLDWVSQRDNIKKSTQHIGIKTSKHVGVGKIGNRFRARCYHDGKVKHIGCYGSPEEAKKAYDNFVARINQDVI